MAKKLTYGELEQRVKELEREVAKLKTIEETLRRTSDEQNVLLSTVSAMIFWIDKEGNFIRANNAFADALQKSPDAINGSSLFDLYPADMAKKYHDDNLEVIRSGTSKTHIEEPLETPAGTMWVSTDKIPFRDGKDDIIGIIGFSQDITDRKRAEEALRKAHDELEEKVQERTSQITKVNEQLEREIGERRQAQDALSQTNAQLQMLQQVTAAVHRTLDVEKVFRQITDGAVHCLGYTTACIVVLNAEKTHFEFKVVSTKKWLLAEIDKTLGFPLTTFSFAADSDANALVNSVLEGRQVVAKTLAEVAYPFVTKKTCSRLQKLGGTKNYIVVPFKVQEEVVGGLVVTSPGEEVSQEQLSMLELFARTVSQAIKNANLHMQTKRAEEALQRAHNQLEKRVRERTAQLTKANEKLRTEITERKQTEQALRESGERFRAMADLLPTIIAEIDLDSRLIYANQAGFDTFGYQQADLEAGLKVIDMIHLDDRERAVKNIRKVIKGERLDGNEYRMLREDGSEVTMLVHSSPLYKNKKITGVRTTLNDITELKRSEEALRQSENKYRELADLLPQTVFEIDERGNFTFANRYGLESSGYTREAIERGLNALQLFIPEDRERVAQNIRRILIGEKSEGHEYTALRKDGSAFPVLVYSSPIIRDNKPVGLRGIVIDIAERKRAEQELQESEEKYRRLFEDANDAIFIADAKTHNILDANRQAERLIGRPRKEIIGMHQSKLHPPHHAEYYEDKFRKYVQEGRVLDLQAEVITKDGRIVPVFISASIVTIHAKQVMQGLFRDATEEKRILDLTAEIATKQLIQKAKAVLMDRHKIDEKEAMRHLQRESRSQRKKLIEIAQAVISTELILN